MTSAVVRTPKLTDGQLYALVQSLLEICPDGGAKITYPLDQTSNVDNETDFSKLLCSTDHLVQAFEFHFDGTVKDKVCFHRGTVESDHWGQHPNLSGFHKVVPNAHFDEIGFLEPPRHTHYGANAPPAPDKLSRDTILAVTRVINSYAVQATFVGQNESATALSDIVAGQIGDLRQLHLEMTRGLAAAAMKDGLVILNVHTDKFNPGEISGSVVAD